MKNYEKIVYEQEAELYDLRYLFDELTSEFNRLTIELDKEKNKNTGRFK